MERVHGVKAVYEVPAWVVVARQPREGRCVTQVVCAAAEGNVDGTVR